MPDFLPLGLILFGVAFAFGWAWWTSPSDDGPRYEGPEFPALERYYSEREGRPVTFEATRSGEYNCVIEYDDGSMGIGLGASPHQAYLDAKDDEGYVFT